MSRNESNSPTTTPTKAEHQWSTSGEVTKLCHIVKRPDFDGYGFNLHSEKIKPGQYIGKVDVNSPAEAAGLKEGDRIIEVNGVAIGNETHKQVVQRIKAIACEVRLLLVDADGGNKVPADIQESSTQYQSGTVQEIPGASANISSISMTSTKRISNASKQSNGNSPSHSQREATTTIASGIDVTDKAMPAVASHNGKQTVVAMPDLKNGNNLMMIPPPPSAATITVPQTSSSHNASNGKAGGLQLPMTAAEMRAKLMSKKKYDPKNESVDLKKKFEIIQKL